MSRLDRTRKKPKQIKPKEQPQDKQVDQKKRKGK